NSTRQHNVRAIHDRVLEKLSMACPYQSRCTGSLFLTASLHGRPSFAGSQHSVNTRQRSSRFSPPREDLKRRATIARQTNDSDSAKMRAAIRTRVHSRDF